MSPLPPRVCKVWENKTWVGPEYTVVGGLWVFF